MHDEPILRLHRVTKRFPGVAAVEDVDLDIRCGEVHVLAGENGAGKSTLMKLLTQVEQPSSGHIEMDGRRVSSRGSGHARKLGIAMVYQELALAPHLSVAENLLLGDEPGRAGYVSRRAQTRAARELLERVGLTVSPDRLVQRLSIAAQQRVELAKALAVFDEPGRGVDVDAKAEMFELIRRLAADGCAIVLISSYLPESLNMCDRILVMREGTAAGTVHRDDFSEERIMALATGAAA